MPSHMQIGRVLDGGLDAAIAWAVPDPRLDIQLLWAEPLDAVVPGRVQDETIAAGRLRVLVDADGTSWRTWNAYVRNFSERPARGSWRSTTAASPARAFATAGGSASPCCRGPSATWRPRPRACGCDPWWIPPRSGRGRSSPAPTTSAQPSLALRENADKLTRAAGLHALPNEDCWVPPDDPHRDAIAVLSLPLFELVVAHPQRLGHQRARLARDARRVEVLDRLEDRARPCGARLPGRRSAHQLLVADVDEVERRSSRAGSRPTRRAWHRGT